jgi:rhamnose utilization protein RhaD (predicted bifunctional aldolase and dehydrogenase)/NAD(P)-dependent dehydrogenase (short-subunit alcohol dehydrogenase family)
MINRWNDIEAANCNNDLLQLRVYTSRLLGQDEDLVLHGGGNTSVKTKETNLFGEEEEIIHVKGSGWDLATIEAAGFAPVKLKPLLQMATLQQLSDTEMVKQQRIAMTDPSAPNPSVEAILHAIIPFTFVDHTHADAVVTISNTPNGSERIEEVYGKDFLIVPYVMPGFVLAREVYQLTRNTNWQTTKGIILLHHGIFTFHDDAKTSYGNMIEAVTKAETYLATHNKAEAVTGKAGNRNNLLLARLRQAVSRARRIPVLAQQNNDEQATSFSNRVDVAAIATRGPLTPDHIIRTKRIPVIISGDTEKDISDYVNGYDQYFKTYSTKQHISLDPAPRWGIWPTHGVVYFDTSINNLNIIRDITHHTMKAISQAEQLGGWKALRIPDLFEMEYWSLEQEKLKKAGKPKPMQGKIALVTGAASGIGKACVEILLQEGAVVAALDINKEVCTCFKGNGVLPLVCDVTDTVQIKNAIEATVAQFGGLDMVVANAGIFPKSFSIGEMDETIWNKSMHINVTSQQQLLQYALPYLESGIDSAIVIIGSKNVPAPGPGAAAYSVAKAALTQLGRIAAMEFGAKGIRVNMVHPNAVYDTGIWTDEVLEARAKHYGQTVAEYKTNNILKTEITSRDVAGLVCTLLGSVFSKITGAQVPIDGGNDRII